MSAPRIAVVGDGKMGRTIERLATDRRWTVVTVIGAEDNVAGSGITRHALRDAEVVIEFTEPAAAPANIRACAAAGYPVVVGTTGWLAELEAVSRDVAAAGGALLWAANFSIGVNVFLSIAEAAARHIAAAPGFDAHLVETHHAAKKDAPSGTALAIGSAVEPGLGRRIPITSVRTGSVPGTHELLFDAPFEQIRLAHEARDRRVFAEGALLAASWLRGRRGVFTMRDVLSPTATDSR